jgi:hypothetical protein
VQIEEYIDANPILKPLKRGSGRRPNGSENLITALIKEKKYPDSRTLAQAFFRGFTGEVLADKVRRIRIFLLAKDNSRYKEIVEMAEYAHSIYPKEGINDEAKSNLLSRLCFNFTKEDLEEFFKDPILSYLFFKFFDKIMSHGYHECPGRRNNRRKAIERRANQASSEVPS